MKENQQHFIDLEDVRSDEYDMMIEIKGEDEHTCFLCGRQTSAKSNSYVHYTTHGYLTDLNEEQLKDYDFGESQGCFKVGSECKKDLPSGFVFQLG